VLLADDGLLLFDAGDLDGAGAYVKWLAAAASSAPRGITWGGGGGAAGGWNEVSQSVDVRCLLTTYFVGCASGR